MERLNEEALRLSLLKRSLDTSSTSSSTSSSLVGGASAGAVAAAAAEREELLCKRVKVEGHQAMERLKMLAFLKRKDLAGLEAMMGLTEFKGHHPQHHGALLSAAAANAARLAGGAYDERTNGSLRLSSPSSLSGGVSSSHAQPMGRSRKENMGEHQEPVDMSAKKSDRQCVTGSPDVIVLSDNEASSPKPACKLERCPNVQLLKGKSVEERQKVITSLKEELRMEEACLVLLRKLRHSQLQKENLNKVPGVQNASLQTGSVHGAQPNNKMSVRATIHPPEATHPHPPSQAPSVIRSAGTGAMGQLMGQRSLAPSPAQLQTHRLTPKQPAPRPPTGPNTPVSYQQQVAMSQQQQQQQQQRSSSTSSSSSSSAVMYMNLSSQQQAAVSPDPASSQAAAKLALRKQLEKTLLDIPPPNPPAPLLHFLPSAANGEFIYMIGLEEVVDSVLDSQGKMCLPLSSMEPFSCAQCQTDFTPHWKQETGGRILCETCMSSNQKKALKAEHTNRLKNAFVKALQQEQEIEQRMQMSSSSSHTPPSGSKDALRQHRQLHQPSHPSHPPSVQQRGGGSVSGSAFSHQSSSHSQFSMSAGLMGLQQAVKHSSPLASAGHSRSHHHHQQQQQQQQHQQQHHQHQQQQQQQQHQHQQQQQQHQQQHHHHDSRRNIYSLPGMSLGYLNPASLASPKSSSLADRQREYLLDMIPPRSISQSLTGQK